MYARVVRFADVDPERLRQMTSRIEESGGAPEGVNSTGLRVLLDESQGTAVVVQLYDSAEDMEESAKVFDAMDSSETPGRRVSVDTCEQVLRVDM